MRKFIRFTLPAIAWMVIIFFMSSRQKVSVSNEFVLNFFIFKSIHVIEYAILYILWLRAITQGVLNKNVKKYLFMAVIFALLYAVSDELHQTFVPTREGTVRDVFIDLAGICAMYILCLRNNRFLRRVLR